MEGSTRIDITFYIQSFHIGQSININNKFDKKMTQTSKNETWVDESGTRIPYKRVTKAERLMEVHSARLAKDALAVNGRLIAFKKEIKQLCEEAEQAFLDENKLTRDEKFKGNYTWYNFDRSIRIERSVNEALQYDDQTIMAAKEILHEFLSESLDSSKDFVKEMILTAFENKNGKLDPKKITPLTRHEKRVNDPRFTEACNLIKKAERRPDSKVYYRVSTKNVAGAYEAIELNFSNI